MDRHALDHTDKSKESTQNYVFNVEIKMEATSDGVALEQLTHLLNRKEVTNFRILNQKVVKKQKKVNTPEHTNDSREIFSQIVAIKEKGSLVRLSINKGKGVKMNFSCRVLNIDPMTYNISVYHVDEKNVYLFQLNEIDDLTEII